MPNKDLREWIAKVGELGEIERVEGADWDLEIGGLVDLHQRKAGRPALLFDNVRDYPQGYQILAGFLTSVRRIAVALDLPTDLTPVQMVQRWKEIWKNLKPIPPVTVEGGPVFENVLTGDDINLLKFPVPKWHEGDGGRYIGTGCVVVMRDPDTGWINLGTYRVMIHDEKNAALYISPGKHGRLIREKYWSRGKPCPVAICCGQDPLLFVASSLEAPYQESEYDIAGGIRGAPVEVVKGPTTGLPIPATAEIVLEGEITPHNTKPEGPFGEWTGYYASGSRAEPVVPVSAVLHRHNPILLGAVPQVPPCDVTYYRGILRSAMIWEQIERAGIPEVKGVWLHEAGGARLWITVAIKQMYGGHSRQAGLVAAACHAGAYANRVVVVVDEDTDPTDTNQVLWAICTRCNPSEDVEIIKRSWSTPLDPMSYPSEGRMLNSRMIIDACRPWERIREFPAVALASPELKERLEKKWPQLFDKPWFRD